MAKLAKEANIDLTQIQIDQLNEITTFNIEARYDIIKEKLYKKATKAFAQKYMKITDKLFNYLKELV